MRWLAFGKPKESIDGYKFNFYENMIGEFFLVVWRKPRFRRVVFLGRHIRLDTLDKIVDVGLPRDVALLINKDTQRFLGKWV
jgi:hypothetical protein